MNDRTEARERLSMFKTEWDGGAERSSVEGKTRLGGRNGRPPKERRDQDDE